MDTQKTIKVQGGGETLLSDRHYYNYIFKKTEKIVCAVFYILQQKKDKEVHKKDTITDIEQAAKQTLERVIHTLSLEPHEAPPHLKDLLAGLVALQSYLEVGRFAGVLSDEAVDVLVGELEGVMRSTTRYIKDAGKSLTFEEEMERTSQPRPQREHTATPQALRTNQGSRQHAIKRIIEERDTVSIKDISEHIKDCSEKTIQRELNDMIEKGLIKREGERRWSQYSLI